MLYNDVDVSTQTVLSVFPHFITENEENQLRVLGNVSVQTETTIGKHLNWSEIEALLVWTPYVDISRDALRITDIPKKYVLTFNDSMSIKTFEEDDFEDLNNQGSTQSIASQNRTSSFAQGKSNLKKVMMNGLTFVEVECQTDLMIRPFILDVDHIAEIFHVMEVQTSATFAPDANIELVTKALHKYQMHNAVPSKAICQNASHAYSSKYHQINMDRSKGEYNNNDTHRIITEVIYEDYPEATNRKDKVPCICSNCDSQNIANKDKDPEQEDDPQAEFENIGTALKQLTSDEIQEICNGCCTEAQVLDRIQCWYKEVHCMLEEESGDEFDPISGQNMEQIKAEILAIADETVHTFETQLDRMQKRYYPVETNEVEVQAQDSPTHISKAGPCLGSKFRDVSCSCDCHLLEGVPGANYNQTGCGVDHQKFVQWEALGSVRAHTATIERNITSSPAVMTCVCTNSSDLPNEAEHANVKTELPLKARACTNRKCNCFHSKGCLYCEQALKRMQEKQNSSERMDCPPYRATSTSQNIEFLADVDEDYIDDYLQLLEPDNISTQVEDSDWLEATRPKTGQQKPRPCTCLNVMEMPWDMLVITPAPQPPQRRHSPEQKPENECKPEPEQLSEEEYKANLEQELEEAANQENEGGENGTEKTPPAKMSPPERNINCRKRPPLKPFQVFDPEWERYNEPYMDRMHKFFGEDDLDGADECTSRIEMPWSEIELPKNVRIRKHNPCQTRKVTNLSSKDPNRKCGPEYRASLNQQRRGCGTEIISCKQGKKPNPNQSQISCTCMSQPQIPLHKGVSDTCMCSGKNQDSTKKASNSMSAIPKDSNPVKIRSATGADNAINQSATGMGKTASAQSRTERIAALLDSCKKEMEPIKDGINQLRARIKELNLPDLMSYQEKPQHPYSGMPTTSGFPMIGSDMYGMPGMQMPMCYPPGAMMCYPYPPSCMPGMSNHSCTRKCSRCKSKQKKNSTTTSNCTTSATSRSTSPSSEYEKKNHQQKSHSCLCKASAQNSKLKQCPKHSDKKLMCACGVVVSIPPTTGDNANGLACSGKGSSGSQREQGSKIPRPVGQPTVSKSVECHCSHFASAKTSSHVSCKCSPSEACKISSSTIMVTCQGTQCKKNASSEVTKKEEGTCSCSK